VTGRLAQARAEEGGTTEGRRGGGAAAARGAGKGLKKRQQRREQALTKERELAKQRAAAELARTVRDLRSDDAGKRAAAVAAPGRDGGQRRPPRRPS